MNEAQWTERITPASMRRAEPRSQARIPPRSCYCMYCTVCTVLYIQNCTRSRARFAEIYFRLSRNIYLWTIIVVDRPEKCSHVDQVTGVMIRWESTSTLGRQLVFSPSHTHIGGRGTLCGCTYWLRPPHSAFISSRTPVCGCRYACLRGPHLGVRLLKRLGW